ncbi:transcription initiation factor IID, 31kD subunit-domain-containing protein [Cytidiella melzeri]|nr:transcription initiation factor IID, 31kD subunit-domain-containing protein [Cytidiella melzeri]
MSRSTVAETLPPTARSIALLLASTPTVQDAQPAVLHQLLEFSHRYTSQVLSDALVYAEHAGHPNKLEMEDVVLAVQSRVGWEFGGRIPKEYTLSLAAQINAVPLPSVPEVFGVRLPPASECLTSVDFDLVPNKPPPGVKLYDEELEEIEESEDEDGDMEPATIPTAEPSQPIQTSQQEPIPPPMAALHSPSEMDIMTPGIGAPEEASDGEGAGLFSGGEEEEESGDEAMDVSMTAPAVDVANGAKRKLVEEDDYD